MRAPRPGSAPRPSAMASHGAQAEHDRLAVRQPIVALDLEGVAEGVAQVERPSLAGLEGVPVDDAQLELHRALHHRVPGRLVGCRAVRPPRQPRRGSPAASTARDRR